MVENKKPRTLVNLIGAPLLLSIIYLGGPLFILFIFVVIFISTYEFNNMIKIKSYSLNLYFFFFIYLICLINHLFQIFSNEQYIYFILFIFFSILISCLNIKNKLKNFYYRILAFIWIGFLFQEAIYLRSLPEIGFKIVLCMFLSVWVTDSFAFIFGSKFGKSKILPSVSPKKTWVGFLAGYIACTLFIYCLFSYNYFNNSLFTFDLFDIIVLGFISGVLGQCGDFFESYYKRFFSVKDSGTLLQGHGGFLDRFDSLLFVVPLFSFYLRVIL